MNHMIRLVTPTLQFSNASFSVLVIFHSIRTHCKQIMTKSECEEEYILSRDLERCSPSCQEIHGPIPKAEWNTEIVGIRSLTSKHKGQTGYKSDPHSYSSLYQTDLQCNSVYHLQMQLL